METDAFRHWDRSYNFRVYASGQKQSVPPCPLRTSVPDGELELMVTGRWAAGGSEDRVPINRHTHLLASLS
jgi:hypothetical protein